MMTSNEKRVRELRRGLMLVVIAVMAATLNETAAETTRDEGNQPDSLVKRIETLERFSGKIQEISKWMPAIGGYMSVGYTYDENTSSFEMRTARVDAKGKLPLKLDYRLLVDLYKFQAYDVWMGWRPFKELNFCGGQFKVPFTLGNRNGPIQEELIDYPLVLRQLVMGGLIGDSNSGRDVGVSVSGSFRTKSDYTFMDYAIGVFNGNGMRAKDVNKSKDVTGRLTFHPVKGLALSGSYYWGERGADYQRYNRWSVGALYNSGFFFARGEYVKGRTGDVSSEGWYGLVGMNAPYHLSPVVRIDSFESNLDLRDTQRDYTVGVVYRPFKFLRIQANFVRQTYAESCGKSNGNQYKVVIMGIL